MIHITSLRHAQGAPTLHAVTPEGRGMPARRPVTLLIIEHDPTMRLALACMVADESRQIVVADSAEQAMKRLSLVDPDLILCGDTPGVPDQQAFCTRLKATVPWRRVPLIVLADHDDPEWISRLLDSGADDVIVDPVHSEELRARVQVGLRARWRSGAAGWRAASALQPSGPVPLR